MTLSGTGALVTDAAARGRAVAAVNLSSLEHAEAIIAGAEHIGSNIILQISQNAIRSHDDHLRPLLAACRELAEASTVRVALHLDHLDDVDLIETGIRIATEFGLGSIMIDFATHSYDDNVRATADATERARAVGLWVEAELGAIGGKDGAHAPGVRTDPGQAAQFVAATGVDGLAVAVGSSHAMRDRTARLDHELIRRLAAAVPVPLVLHGASGVDDADLRRAVEAGIRKVNVGTALNVAGTGAVRRLLADRPELVDPRPLARASRDAMAGVVAATCRVLA